MPWLVVATPAGLARNQRNEAAARASRHPFYVSVGIPADRGVAPARSRLARFQPWFHQALFIPPVPLTLHIVPRVLAEVGRAEDEDLEAPRPGLVASPRTGRDAHHVPLLELDDLVVEH